MGIGYVDDMGPQFLPARPVNRLYRLALIQNHIAQIQLLVSKRR